ncbi:MAG: hypothetical protein K2L10_05660 [Ruminococcus sp.]|nr:hypothetical protein [Ruminococcus sp.]
MIDENMFICCEIDEDEDYCDEFKAVVDNIIKYLESTLNVTFEKDVCDVQAIDIYDCNIIRYYASLCDSDNTLVVNVPIDQFQICIEDLNNKVITVSYCAIDIPQYSQENLDKMREVLLDFEEQYKKIKN